MFASNHTVTCLKKAKCFGVALTLPAFTYRRPNFQGAHCHLSHHSLRKKLRQGNCEPQGNGGDSQTEFDFRDGLTFFENVKKCSEGTSIYFHNDLNPQKTCV